VLTRTFIVFAIRPGRQPLGLCQRLPAVTTTPWNDCRAMPSFWFSSDSIGYLKHEPRWISIEPEYLDFTVISLHPPSPCPAPSLS
jgi:hypothetical protein